MTDEQRDLIFQHRKALVKVLVRRLTWCNAMLDICADDELEQLRADAYAKSDEAARALYAESPHGTKLKPEVVTWTN